MVPATAAVAKVNVAPTPVFCTPRPTLVEAMLLKVVANVDALEVIEAMPVEPSKDVVTPAAEMSVMLTRSIPDTLERATLVAIVAFNVSVPFPPFSESPEFRVWPAAVPAALPALNVSLPVVLVVPKDPTKMPDASIPAVSVLIYVLNISLYINNLSQFLAATPAVYIMSALMGALFFHKTFFPSAKLLKLCTSRVHC